jgi:Protein of unknown function (DUF4013)
MIRTPESFVFMFRDPDWFSKVFIGALALVLSFTGIGFLLVCGYMVKTAGGVMHGEPYLPEWKDWRSLLKAGSLVTIAIAAYLLPFVGGIILLNHLMLRIFLATIAALLMPAVIHVHAKTGMLRSCFRLVVFQTASRNLLRSLAASGIIFASAAFGWMSLIIGWPCVVFWSMLASSSLIARMD